MINISYSFIGQKIHEMVIEPPKGKTASELTEWLLGYQQCMSDVLSILQELSEGSNS